MYPIIYDANRTVLSLPPLINGEHSKIGLSTRNVFIECTATDLTKAHLVLNTVVSMFSEYCDAPFTVEPVQVGPLFLLIFVHGDNVLHSSPPAFFYVASRLPHCHLTLQVTYEVPPPMVTSEGYITPDMSPRSARAGIDVIRSVIGNPDITVETAAALARKMQLDALPSPDGSTLLVQVPPHRPDILHECDVVEDVAIAYGYNNIVRSLPATLTTGAQLPINKLTDSLRMELARAGYDECLTFALVSRDDNFARMLLEDDGKTAVVLANPQTEEFQLGRTALVPGLLKSLASNRAVSLRDGLKLFEVSDVMLLDATTDTGARNERHLAALYTGPTAGFEVIHGLVDRVMMLLEVPHRPFAWESSSSSSSGSAGAEGASYGRGGLRYHVEPETTVPSYFPGRGARVVVERRGDNGDVTRVVAGSFGVLHPKVLSNFELGFPVSVVELNIEHFL